MIARDVAGLRHLALLICLVALSGNAAFGAEPKVVVVVVQRGDTFIVDATVDVQVPLRTAWAVLTDFDHMTSILENLTFSKVVRRDGDIWIVRQEGVAKYGLFSFSFNSEREMRLEPMKRILARQLSGTLKRMESEARITALDNAVQIKYHAESLPDSILARMFGTSFARHEVEEQLLAMGREMTRRNDSAVEPPVGTAPARPVSAGN